MPRNVPLMLAVIWPLYEGSAVTVAAQDEPKNHWQIHPLIDGCDGGEEPPPVIK